MLRKLLLLIMATMLAIISKSQVSVITQHNNLLRTGWNNNETILKPANVNVRQFGKLFSVPVDDQIYSQPLVMAKVFISGASHTVVYAATVNNTVYAIDGDSGKIYWSKNFTPAGQRPARNTDMTGVPACGGRYKDFSGNMGIVGTPVIDSVTKTMFFVARSKDTVTDTYYQFIHAIEIRTGKEKANSPVLVTATFKGTGDGSIDGIVQFDSQKENQRQGLSLYQNTLYVSFGSICDWRPYHGWILGYDAATLQQKYVYNTTPDGFGAGVWQSGGGPSIDADGNLFVVSGNGSVGTAGNPSDVKNRGESALRLTPQDSTLAVKDFFTPNNYPLLDRRDLDYGSMAGFLIPNSNLYFTGCKDGNLYLLDKNNLGGYDSLENNARQTISLGSGITLRCQPSYYKSDEKEFVYVWSENSQLKAIPVNRNNNDLNANNLITGAVGLPIGTGALTSTTSDNSKDGSGILWASHLTGSGNIPSVRPGVLRAYDADDVTKELWNSNLNAARDSVGNFAKFSAPTVANGKVYLATFSNRLIAYGIIDSTTASCGDVNLALNKQAYSSSNESETYLPSLAFDDNLTTHWSSAPGIDTQWIYVDLGEIDSICNVVLQWDAALAKNFKLQVSNDAQYWKTVSTVISNTTYVNTINVNRRGRYVRLYAIAHGTVNKYSLYEFKVYGSVIQSCLIPDGVTVNNIDTASAVIRWNTTNALSYNVAYKLTSDANWQIKSTTEDSLLIEGLSCNNYYVYHVQSVCNNNTLSSYSQDGMFNTLTCNDCGLLPTRTYTADIGNVGIPGEVCFLSPSTYVVNGSGENIYSSADEFRYVYKTFEGDGKIVVKVAKQDKTNPSNKAGIMFRQSLDSTSRNVFIGLTSGNGVNFQYRNTTGGITQKLDSGGYIAPYYLSLVKKGTIYKGYISSDGITWNFISKTNIKNMGASGSSIYAGIAVASHNNSKLSTAIFQRLKITYSASPAQSKTFNTKKSFLNQQVSVLVYPNPVRSILNINITKTFSSNAMQVSIFNATGKEVLSQEVYQNAIHINVEQLTSGAYFVKVANSKGKLLFKGKFIKE